MKIGQAYDNRKIRGPLDTKDFACTESWEVDYLVSKIRKVYGEGAIRNAITSCCKTVGAPHPRKAFLECVMQKLRG